MIRSSGSPSTSSQSDNDPQTGDQRTPTGAIKGELGLWDDCHCDVVQLPQHPIDSESGANALLVLTEPPGSKEGRVYSYGQLPFDGLLSRRRCQRGTAARVVHELGCAASPLLRHRVRAGTL